MYRDDMDSISMTWPHQCCKVSLWQLDADGPDNQAGLEPARDKIIMGVAEAFRHVPELPCWAASEHLNTEFQASIWIENVQ